MTDEKLLDKITKLLAKGHGTDNAEEAGAFLAKAAEMMEQHGIDGKRLGRHQIAEAVVKSTQSVSKPKDWESSLMHVIAKAFGCRLMWRAGHSRNVDNLGRSDYWGRWVFVGHKDRAQLAEYSAVVLLRQLVKERAAFTGVLAGRGYRRGSSMTAQLDGFCKGWIKVVRTKVHAFANDADLQAIIDDYIDELCKGNKANNHNRGNGLLGNLMGQEAAADVHLNRPMSGAETLRIA